MSRMIHMIALAAVIASASACQTAGTVAIQADKDIAAKVCTVWSPITYDSRYDTKETTAQVRANNRARAAYCK